jgi:hypothetical protein
LRALRDALGLQQPAIDAHPRDAHPDEAHLDGAR